MSIQYPEFMRDDHLYVFDVDGTLTPSRQKMDEAFKRFFSRFASRNFVYLVTGSDRDKTMEQVGADLYGLADRVYNCSGNHVFEGHNEIYRSNWRLPWDAEEWLKQKLDQSMFHIKTGAHFDHRIGCCNFSVIGRNCKLYERKEYVKYDNINKERERIAREFEEKFPDIEAVIGGETGLDIFPRGKNKGQIMEDLDWHSVHFFGDKMEEGGNDAPLGNRIDNRPFGYTYAVKDWKHTWEILEGFTYT